MQTGLDRLVATPNLCRSLLGARVGLLAHPASVTRDLSPITSVLRSLGIRLEVLFGPEHGYGGEAQDMVGVSDQRGACGTLVRSLYGDRIEDLSPAAEDLAGLDVLLIDLQDVGARYYTFVWTAVLALRAASRAGVRVVVLDRPNPLGGDETHNEGRCQQPGYRSFVGLEPVPIRHALTLGEIVAWRAHVEGVSPEGLRVVAVQGLARNDHATSWDRPFVPPSPYMPTYRTALVYPGACLLEGTNVSEGRGTTCPFEVLGAPWLDGVRLAAEVAKAGLTGFRLRPMTFRPMFHKYAATVCGGVQVHPVDGEEFRPVATYLAIVAAVRGLYPERFRFRTERYEFVDTIPAFDLLTGSGEARGRIEAGASVQEVLEVVRTGEEERQVVAAARRAGAERSM